MMSKEKEQTKKPLVKASINLEVKASIDLEVRELFERVKCSPPGQNFKIIKEKLEVLKLMKETIS